MANKLELKAECVRQGIELKQLADAIGIAYSSLINKMNGVTDYTRNDMLSIRQYLHLSDELFLKIFF